MKGTLIAILTVLCIAYGTESPAQQASDYYPLHKGNTWEYKRIDSPESADGPASYTVAVTSLDPMNGDSCHRVETHYPGGNGSIQWLSVNPGGSVVWNALGSGNGLVLTDWKPPIILLRHDAVKKGTAWDYSYAVTMENGLTATATIHFKVIDTDETVTVEAGRFNGCIEVNMRHEQPDSPIFSVNTSWYAPGVGLVKSARTDTEGLTSTFELAEYSVHGE